MLTPQQRGESVFAETVRASEVPVVPVGGDVRKPIVVLQEFTNAVCGDCGGLPDDSRRITLAIGKRRFRRAIRRSRSTSVTSPSVPFVVVFVGSWLGSRLKDPRLRVSLRNAVRSAAVSLISVMSTGLPSTADHNSTRPVASSATRGTGSLSASVRPGGVCNACHVRSGR